MAACQLKQSLVTPSIPAAATAPVTGRRAAKPGDSPATLTTVPSIAVKPAATTPGKKQEPGKAYQDSAGPGAKPAQNAVSKNTGILEKAKVQLYFDATEEVKASLLKYFAEQDARAFWLTQNDGTILHIWQIVKAFSSTCTPCFNNQNLKAAVPCNDASLCFYFTLKLCTPRHSTEAINQLWNCIRTAVDGGNTFPLPERKGRQSSHLCPSALLRALFGDIIPTCAYLNGMRTDGTRVGNCCSYFHPEIDSSDPWLSYAVTQFPLWLEKGCPINKRSQQIDGRPAVGKSSTSTAAVISADAVPLRLHSPVPTLAAITQHFGSLVTSVAAPPAAKGEKAVVDPVPVAVVSKAVPETRKKERVVVPETRKKAPPIAVTGYNDAEICGADGPVEGLTCRADYVGGGTDYVIAYGALRGLTGLGDLATLLDQYRGCQWAHGSHRKGHLENAVSVILYNVTFRKSAPLGAFACPALNGLFGIEPWHTWTASAAHKAQKVTLTLVRGAAPAPILPEVLCEGVVRTGNEVGIAVSVAGAGATAADIDAQVCAAVKAAVKACPAAFKGVEAYVVTVTAAALALKGNCHLPNTSNALGLPEGSRTWNVANSTLTYKAPAAKKAAAKAAPAAAPRAGPADAAWEREYAAIMRTGYTAAQLEAHVQQVAAEEKAAKAARRAGNIAEGTRQEKVAAVKGLTRGEFLESAWLTDSDCAEFSDAVRSLRRALAPPTESGEHFAPGSLAIDLGGVSEIVGLWLRHSNVLQNEFRWGSHYAAKTNTLTFYRTKEMMERTLNGARATQLAAACAPARGVENHDNPRWLLHFLRHTLNACGANKDLPQVYFSVVLAKLAVKHPKINGRLTIRPGCACGRALLGLDPDTAAIDDLVRCINGACGTCKALPPSVSGTPYCGGRERAFIAHGAAVRYDGNAQAHLCKALQATLKNADHFGKLGVAIECAWAGAGAKVMVPGFRELGAPDRHGGLVLFPKCDYDESAHGALAAAVPIPTSFPRIAPFVLPPPAKPPTKPAKVEVNIHSYTPLAPVKATSMQAAFAGRGKVSTPLEAATSIVNKITPKSWDKLSGDYRALLAKCEPAEIDSVIAVAFTQGVAGGNSLCIPLYTKLMNGTVQARPAAAAVFDQVVSNAITGTVPELVGRWHKAREANDPNQQKSITSKLTVLSELVHALTAEAIIPATHLETLTAALVDWAVKTDCKHQEIAKLLGAAIHAPVFTAKPKSARLPICIQQLTKVQTTWSTAFKMGMDIHVL